MGTSRSQWFPAKRSCSDTLIRNRYTQPRGDLLGLGGHEGSTAIRRVDRFVTAFLSGPGRGDLGLSDLDLMWAKIFRSVSRWYRDAVSRIRPVHHEEDCWLSYGLSYLALRDSARRGKHEHFSYVYSACKNRHKRHLKWERRNGVQALEADGLDRWCVDSTGEVQLHCDLGEALANLDRTDAIICHMRLVEARSFSEIGASVGLHESSVFRRFRRALPSIQQTLADYEDTIRGEGIEEQSSTDQSPYELAA